MKWHYVKNITKKPRIIFPRNVMGTNKELLEFTNNTEEAKGGNITGRAWRSSEMRLKSKCILSSHTTINQALIKSFPS
jgi:hypothetical protein